MQILLSPKGTKYIFSKNISTIGPIKPSSSNSSVIIAAKITISATSEKAVNCEENNSKKYKLLVSYTCNF